MGHIDPETTEPVKQEILLEEMNDDFFDEHLKERGIKITKSEPNKHAVFFGYGESASNPKVRFTIAMVPTGINTCSVGIAICSEKDQFNKKIGRTMAEGRANKRPYMMIVGMDTTTVEGMLSIKTMMKNEIRFNVDVIKREMSALSR